MRIDSLQQFVKLRRELTQERDQVSRRLAQINEALGEISPPSLSAAQDATEQVTRRAPSPQPSRVAANRAGGASSAGGGGTSLREHVLAVLREGAKTKEEVLGAVKRRGYTFQTKDPLNSLGVILYGKNPKFNRVDGRFSLPGGVARGGSAPEQSGGGGGGRRQMSAAARARIAEAQRKRWAASRKEQGTGSSQSSATKSSGGGAARRSISAAGRKAIAEAARRRWAAAKASGKNKL